MRGGAASMRARRSLRAAVTTMAVVMLWGALTPAATVVFAVEPPPSEEPPGDETTAGDDPAPDAEADGVGEAPDTGRHGEVPFIVPEPEPLTATGTLVIEIPDPGVMNLDDGRRFYERLELVVIGGDVVMINDLTMDGYISGLAEMPSRWPIEALKAQAVAARTYAWRTLRADRYPGYDICATVDCQVFRGAGVVLDSETGERWREAVRATSNEVLLDSDGSPILARYFSTSGGRTYANEEVFESSGSFPYLVGFDDPYDAASPLHSWTARFTREQFDEILARGATLSAAVPVASVARDGEITDQQASIVVTSVTGVTARVGAVAFRSFVSNVAAQLFPDEFPGPRADGEARLPTALPSSRFAIEVTDDEVVFDGRGWGHGVGMGQYGAYARAEEGATYDEILAAYYGGLTPQVSAEVPERIRVGMTIGLPRRISGDGVFSVVADGLEVGSTMGTWTIDRQDGAWVLLPPRGHDQPLEGTPTRLVEAYGTVGAATVEVAVNKPVALTLEILDATRNIVREDYLGIIDYGVHAYTWDHTDADGRPVAPGDYLVTLRGVDLDGARFGTPVPVNIPEPPPPPAPPVAVDGQDDDAGWSLPAVNPAILVGILGLALIIAAIFVRDRP